MPFEMTMCAKQISQAVIQPVRPIEMTMCAKQISQAINHLC